MHTKATMSRRGLLAGVPAIAVAVAPAAATALSGLPAGVADDPIFAAIEALKKADREYCESYADYEGDSWRDEHPDIAGAYDAACLAMEETSPTTVAGASALLSFYCEDDPWFAGSPSWHEPAVMSDGEIEFMSYEDDPAAPVIFINGVGRICKIGAGTLQVTLIQSLQLADGPIAKAVCHQIWDEKAWLDHEKIIRFAATMLRGPHIPEAKRLRLFN